MNIYMQIDNTQPDNTCLPSQKKKKKKKGKRKKSRR